MPTFAESVRRGYASWIFGLLALTLLIVVVLRIGELERFAALARDARPQWLLVALALQLVTYVCAAAVWYRTLAAAHEHRPLRSLVPLGLAKLFTDQALPSAGLSGTLLLLKGLTRRGVPTQLATQTLLVTLVSFYSAYLTAALISVAILWLNNEVNPAMVTVAAAFCAIAVGLPAMVLTLKSWGKRLAGTRIMKLPGIAALLENVIAAPTDLLRDRRLIAESFILQFGVFVLDALTFWVIFRAMGQTADLSIVFVSFIMSSAIATISPLPVGVGLFEASSVGLLSLLGIEVEVALAATLLLRGLTFWLPMLPGLWLARRELSGSLT